MNRWSARAHVSLAAACVLALYLALLQPTWSVDGAIHTLNSLRPASDFAAGHLLLCGVAWGWTSIVASVTPLTLAARYDLLQGLFLGLGVTALTLLFAVALRRSGPVPAWLALALVAMSRSAERQIASFDEKPLGMVLFACALLVTEKAYRRLADRAVEPTLRDVLPAGLAWLLAAFGHLQNVPFAVAAMAALLAFHRGPGRVLRWTLLMLRLGPVLIVAALALFGALYAQDGGITALPRVARFLFADRPAPAVAAGLPTLVKSTLLGAAKSVFFVDRVSPPWALAVALAGAGVLLVTLALGLRRRLDPLALALAGGGLALLLVVPAANFFPEFGDSYTMIAIALLVLLASAPRRALALATALVWLVNLPPAISVRRPETTMQRHLDRMVEVQEREAAPWVLLHELGSRNRQQQFAPIYYRMSDRLRHVRASLDALPAGRFLVELPQVIAWDEVTRPGRVEDVQRELRARGRSSRRIQLWEPLRTVRSDFRRYGEALVVAAAAATDTTN